MELSLIQLLLGVAAGVIVGASLGLVGGGGGILAVPLLLYLVGVNSPHVAIGTSAVAVAVSAAMTLASHARGGTVKWPCGLVLAASGVFGAYGGSTLGKVLDPKSLLAAFAFLMIAVSLLMLRRQRAIDRPEVRLGPDNLGKLVALGLAAGFLAGLFGIGGGFLIVPVLLLATRMPMLFAVGSSLVAVTAFGITTASNYALSGLVSWSLAAALIAGGAAGGLLGSRAARLLANRQGLLTRVFAFAVLAVAVYMLVQSLLG